MIPDEVADLYASIMGDIGGEPFRRGSLNGADIYGYALDKPMCLGHIPIVVGDSNGFRVTEWSEMLLIEHAISENALTP